MLGLVSAALVASAMAQQTPPVQPVTLPSVASASDSAISSRRLEIPEMVAANAVLSLDGRWQFAFTNSSASLGTLLVPGSVEGQGFGPRSATMRHSNGQNCSYTCLQPGQAVPPHPWANFSRHFATPKSWQRGVDSRVILRVERVHRAGQVLLDGRLLANLSNYLVPTEITLPGVVLAGAVHRLDILVDGWYDPLHNNLMGCSDFLDPSGGGFAGGWTAVSGHVDLLLVSAEVSLKSNSLVVVPNLETAPDGGDIWSIDVTVELQRGSAKPTVGAGSEFAADVTFAVVDFNSNATVTAATRSDAGQTKFVTTTIRMPNCTTGCAWTPEHPRLFRIYASLPNGNAQHTRFGLRVLSTSGPHFLLNNKPYFLRGFGDDATDYIFSALPTNPGPPVEETAYRRKLSQAKRLGFNYFRPHSQVVAPEYLRLASEVGMFVSIEFPANLLKTWSKGTPGYNETVALLFDGFNATIKYYGNQPAAFDYAVANEDYQVNPGVESMRPLHDICKALQNTSFCIDSDGLAPPTAEMIDPDTRSGTLRRDDFVAVNFEEQSCYDSTAGSCDARFAVGAPARWQHFPIPVVNHEANNYNTFPRYTRLIDAVQKTVIKPNWLIPLREQMLRLNLSSEEAIFATSSEKLFQLITKVNVEVMRAAPTLLAGYQ